MASVGKNIRNLRTSKNMTQDELAGLLFVSRQTVSNYETGKSKPDIEMLVKIAETFGTDPNSLIYGIPKQAERKREFIKLAAAGAWFLLLASAEAFLAPVASEIVRKTFIAGPGWLIGLLLHPCCFLTGGWVLMQLFILIFKVKPVQSKYAPWIHRILIGAIGVCFVLMIPEYVSCIGDCVQAYRHLNGGREMGENVRNVIYGVLPVWYGRYVITPLMMFLLRCSGCFLIFGMLIRGTAHRPAQEMQTERQDQE